MSLSLNVSRGHACQPWIPVNSGNAPACSSRIALVCRRTCAVIFFPSIDGHRSEAPMVYVGEAMFDGTCTPRRTCGWPWARPSSACTSSPSRYGWVEVEARRSDATRMADPT